MDNIPDLIRKLPPIMDATMSLFTRMPVLYPVNFAMNNLQQCYYWLKSANEELTQQTDSTLLLTDSGATSLPPFKSPTLLGTKDYFDYLTTALKETSKEVWDHTRQVPVPVEIEYKINRAYDQVMEASFNIELALNYYEQIGGSQNKS